MLLEEGGGTQVLPWLSKAALEYRSCSLVTSSLFHIGWKIGLNRDSDPIKGTFSQSLSLVPRSVF